MSDVNFGPCPHCQSDDLVVVPSGPADGYGRSSINVGALTAIGLSRVVCLRCGSVREWVADREHLKRLRQKFGREQG